MLWLFVSDGWRIHDLIKRKKIFIRLSYQAGRFQSKFHVSPFPNFTFSCLCFYQVRVFLFLCLPRVREPPSTGWGFSFCLFVPWLREKISFYLISLSMSFNSDEQLLPLSLHELQWHKWTFSEPHFVLPFSMTTTFEETTNNVVIVNNALSERHLMRQEVIVRLSWEAKGFTISFPLKGFVKR